MLKPSPQGYRNLDSLWVRFLRSIQRGIDQTIKDILDLHWLFWSIMLTIGVLLAINSLVNWKYVIYGETHGSGLWIWSSSNGWNFRTVMSVISSITVVTGIVCVVLLMNRKITNFYWGAFNVLLIGLSAIANQTWLNFANMFFYIFPINVYSYFHWKKELGEYKGETRDIQPSKIVGLQWVVLIYAFFLLVVFLYFVSQGIDTVSGKTEAVIRRVFDSVSTSCFIFAQTLALFKKREQYGFWLASDIWLILLWGPWPFVHLNPHGQHVWDFSTFSLMFMYILYFGTAINGLIIWFLPHIKFYKSHHKIQTA